MRQSVELRSLIVSVVIFLDDMTLIVLICNNSDVAWREEQQCGSKQQEVQEIKMDFRLPRRPQTDRTQV